MSAKKLKKAVMRVTDPLDILGFKAAEEQQAQAKQAARAQEEQAREQAMAAAESAAQAQRQIQLDAERQRATQAAAEAQQVTTDTPTLELAGDQQETVQAKRKRFQGDAPVSTGQGFTVSLRV